MAEILHFWPKIGYFLVLYAHTMGSVLVYTPQKCFYIPHNRITSAAMSHRIDLQDLTDQKLRKFEVCKVNFTKI